MARASVVDGLFHPLQVRLRGEVVQGGDSGNDGRERGGNVRVEIVGVVYFAANQVGVNFR